MSIIINGKPMTYRVSALFQYRENYGWPDWDGTGECPQYWKNKQLIPYLLADGITKEMLNDLDFVKRLTLQAIKEHQQFNDCVEYRFMKLEVCLTGSPTCEDLDFMEFELGVEVDCLWNEVVA